MLNWFSSRRILPPFPIISAWLLVAVLLATAPRTAAQVYSGTLTGVVTDATGAVLPGAKAVLTDVEKGLTYAAASDN